MIETLKKAVFAGIGAVCYSKEAIENAVNELVKKGKLSTEDAKDLLNKASHSGEDKWAKAKDAISSKIDEYSSKIPFAKKDKLEELEARIAALEEIAESCKKSTPASSEHCCSEKPATE